MTTKLWGQGPDRQQVRAEAYYEVEQLLLRLQGSAEFAESRILRNAWEVVKGAQNLSEGRPTWCHLEGGKK